VELPGGRIENSSSELNVQTLARLSDPAEFDQLAIVTEGDRIVRLHEIARTELLPLNERISFTVRGEPMLGLAVRPQPGANQIAIVDEAMRRLHDVTRSLPEGVTLDIANDNTRFVRLAITELGETILIALGLVVSVIFFFLGSWRTTLVPAVVIPISLIATFFIIRIAGFSVNVLTLLGLVLSVGLVVDDAIVVVENIHRRREMGLSPIEAAIEGTKEVFLAVIATTLAVVAVFSPILFLGGLTGRLFREFGLVIGGSVLISAFVALSLTPMMAARFASGHDRRPTWWSRIDCWLDRLRAGYRASLTNFLKRKWGGVAVLLVAGALTVAAYRVLPQELAPLEDRNRLTISATAPEGVSYDYMLALMSALETKVNREVPEATLITCQVPASGARSGTGVANTGMIDIMLKPKAERVATQAEIATRLNRLIRSEAGARFNISQEPSVGDRRAGNSVQYVLRAATIDQLSSALPRFLEGATDAPEFSSVDVDLKFTRPELRVALDRERLQNLGITASDVASTLQAALSGQRVAYFNRDGRQYEILQQLSAEYRDDARNLGRLSVRTDTGKLVTLDNLVDVNETVAPPQRFRFNRQASATVSARLADGVTLAAGVSALDRVAAQALPAGVTTALTGSAAEFAESQRGLAYGFAMALLFVYLVLAAQFESWRAPFVIMLTVPLALLGALGALWYLRLSLNIFSQIGIIMLVGLITKNGILLVEFTLQKMAAGARAADAVIEAADTRLRPILMTSVATVLGVLPIALALGAGAESRVSMGVAVIGGLVLGSALTLYVIPAIFILMCSRVTHSPVVNPSETITSASAANAVTVAPAI
jgi:multidrug efflux pump